MLSFKVKKSQSTPELTEIYLKLISLYTDRGEYQASNSLHADVCILYIYIRLCLDLITLGFCLSPMIGNLRQPTLDITYSRDAR